MKNADCNTSERRVHKTERALRCGLIGLMKTKSIKAISVRELSDRTDINREPSTCIMIGSMSW